MCEKCHFSPVIFFCFGFPGFIGFCLKENYLRERIKVGGKTGNLGSNVTLDLQKTRLGVTSDIPMSKGFV